MPWPWESTSALVDARHTTTLTVTRSNTSRGYGYAVTDAGGGAAVMQVETSYFGRNRDLRSLLFLGAASHRPCSMSRSPRPCAASAGGAFFLRADDQRRRVPRRQLLRRGAPDLAVQSSDYGNAITIARRGVAIAQIDKKRSTFRADLAGERTYNVRINPGVDQVLVLALAVVLDQMHNPDHDSRGRR
ncbi:hypothetical protein ZWY2020_025811 [Hordeum vulgare]|nr:hypothetical protein ZWY2020_025811 [Hordeum vulgare]